MASESSKLTTAIYRILAEKAPPATKWGVSVLDARTFDVVVDINAGMWAEALSISKLTTALLIGRLTEKGGVGLDMEVGVERSDVRSGGYLGRLVGEKVTILEQVQSMLQVSDTTAQRALTRFMGGPRACNAALRARPLESASGNRIPLAITKFVPVGGENGESARFYTGFSTPLETAALLAESLRYPVIREALQRNIFGYGLTRDLPGNARPDAGFMAALMQAEDATKPFDRETLPTLQHPAGRSAYPNMMGIDEGERHDVARIGDFVVATFSKGFSPALPESPDHPAHDIQAEIGRAVLANT